jgi:hypothetical protein
LLLLPIRIKQFSRELKNVQLALVPLFLIGGLLTVISFSLHKEFFSSAYQFIFLLVLCVAAQFNRNDKRFVYRTIKNPHLEMYLEYFAVTFLFSIGALMQAHWYFFFCFQILLMALPFLSMEVSTERFYYNPVLKFIDASAFEFLSGVRRSFMVLVLFGLLAVCLAWVKLLPLVFLWLINTSVVSFFGECEPIKILRSQSISPAQFLKSKIILNSKFIVIIFLPVLIINTIFNPEHWIVNIFFSLVQLSLIAFAIINKYRCYEPNKNLDSNSVILSVLSIGSIAPFFLPVPLIMSVVYFPRAINNLKRFL